MNLQKLEKYATIKEKIQALTEEEAVLKKIIIEDMQKSKVEKVESTFGKFTVAKGRMTWEYSDVLKKKSEDIKLRQVKEQQKGTATVVYGLPYLIFTPLNE